MVLPGKGWRKAPDGTWTPPNQMRHTLEIDEDTQEFISDQINKVLAVRVAGKGIESVGEVLKGAVSHPIGFAAVSAAFAALIVGQFGGSEEKENIIITSLETIPGVSPELAEAFRQAFEFSRILFPFVPGLPDIGTPPVVPLTPEEKLCLNLAEQLAGAKASLAAEPNPDFRDRFVKEIDRITEAQAELGC